MAYRDHVRRWVGFWLGYQMICHTMCGWHDILFACCEGELPVEKEHLHCEVIE